MFLNNRYYDPTVGVFLSVDPLVAKTGDPYLYAAGNPTTFADPDGQCAVRYDGGQCVDVAARHSGQQQMLGRAWDRYAGISRVSEAQANGFFIAGVLRPYHDAAGLDIALGSGARFERECSIKAGRPDLCRPGTSPMEIGEVKYDSPRGEDAGDEQLGEYERDPSGPRRGYFGESGSVWAGVIHVNWRRSDRYEGVYMYSFDKWDLAALLAGVAAAYASNRQMRDDLFTMGGATVPVAANSGWQVPDPDALGGAIVIGAVGFGFVASFAQLGGGGGSVGGMFGGGGRVLMM